MAVIINELEVVLDPPQSPSRQPGATTPSAEQQKQPLNPHDFMTVMDREQRNDLRLRAH